MPREYDESFHTEGSWGRGCGWKNGVQPLAFHTEHDTALSVTDTGTNSEADKSQAVQDRAHNDKAGSNDTADAAS